MKQNDSANNRKSRGRPVHTRMLAAFETICEWFELIDETVTLKKTQGHIKSVAGYDHTCSLAWLKQKLMDMYKEQLNTTPDGYPSIITPNTAVRLIKAQIKELSDYSKDCYPVEEKMANGEMDKQWLLKSLFKFLQV